MINGFLFLLSFNSKIHETIYFNLHLLFLFSIQLQLKCTARIHKVYSQSIERSIHEKKPNRIIAEHAIKDNHNKIYQSYPYDQFTVQDAELVDKKDTYLPIQG